MPKVAIYEYGQPLCSKGEIRLARELYATPPARNLMLLEDFNEAKFGRRVSSASDLGHDP